MRIFRGVSDAMHHEAGGRIRPANQVSVLQIMAGTMQAYAGSCHLTVGSSERNAQHLHNKCSAEHPTSFVSFTYDYDRAVYFATFASDTGWVYEADTEQLRLAGIPFFDHVEAMINNHEQEVRVNLQGLEELPYDLILSAVQVPSS